MDYYLFQFNELNEADLKAGEQEKLEQELQTLNNAEEIKSNLSKGFHLLDGGEVNLLSKFNEVRNLLNAFSKINSKLEEIVNRLNTSSIELKDIASEIENIEQEIIYNPERIEEINERINVIYHLEQKHRVSTVDELLAIQNNLSKKLEDINSLDEEISSLTKKVNEAKNELLIIERSGDDECKSQD